MMLGFAVAGAGIGAAIGGTFLGMSAVSIGWSVGSAIGGLLGGGDDVTLPDQQGPRLGELKTQSSTYGVSIPRGFGTFRLAGNIIEAADIHEVATTQTQTSGGKGGPPETTQSQTTYSYNADFAVAFLDCQPDRPITGIRRVWMNGKLMLDVVAGSDTRGRLGGIVSSSTDPGGASLFNSMIVYPGSQTQAVDPTLAAMHPAGMTPAYRGTAYVVFVGLQLEQFG
ncbi:MAG: hypothetical protein ABIS29_08430, partial [Vicinamibacterales bacterium]